MQRIETKRFKESRRISRSNLLGSRDTLNLNGLGKAQLVVTYATRKSLIIKRKHRSQT